MRRPASEAARQLVPEAARQPLVPPTSQAPRGGGVDSSGGGGGGGAVAAALQLDAVRCASEMLSSSRLLTLQAAEP